MGPVDEINRFSVFSEYHVPATQIHGIVQMDTGSDQLNHFFLITLDAY